jgi:dTDP-4-amino-4,6-dideoxygalactose transaminase
MARLTELAARNGLAVVEDACQATGATVQGKMAGGWGDAGVLSFGGSKLLSAGRGGAIVTDREAVFQRAKVHCERGNHAFPLSELQAAVLLPQIEQLADRNRRRAGAAAHFRASCARVGLLTFGHDASDLGSPSYYKLAAWCRSFGTGASDRDLFVRALEAEGVEVGPGFRGFLRRGPRRCRKAGPLDRAAEAADSTLVFHHSLLLEPPEIIDQAAAAVHKVARRWETLRNAWDNDRDRHR